MSRKLEIVFILMIWFWAGKITILVKFDGEKSLIKVHLLACLEFGQLSLDNLSRNFGHVITVTRGRRDPSNSIC